MTLKFTPEAEDMLLEIGFWVEQRNTSESGARYIDKFVDKLQSYALSNVEYSLCRNNVFAKLGLSCISFNSWVIAFKQTKDDFIVYYIAYGASLK